MTSRSAAEVALGVMGVYLVASSVPHLLVSVQLVLQGPRVTNLRWTDVMGPALTLACGMGVIALRSRLATMLSPPTQPAEEGNGTGGVQAAAIAVIGVYFFSAGLNGFLADVWLMSAPWLGHSIRSLSEMAVGAALFFGARGLVVVWQKLRTAGRAKD